MKAGVPLHRRHPRACPEDLTNPYVSEDGSRTPHALSRSDSAATTVKIPGRAMAA